MTYGRLFMILNPNVKVVENGTCVWIYFDSVNHDTLRAEWWNKEIPDEALQAQEPRVMTLQEAINGPQVYFVEFQYHLDRGWVKCDFITHDNVGEVAMLYKDGKTFYQQETTYGRLWRLWNARPSDEQRKAVNWE